MAVKSLRSKKGSEASSDLAEDNLEQIRLLIASLTDKIDKLDADNRKRIKTEIGGQSRQEQRGKIDGED